MAEFCNQCADDHGFEGDFDMSSLLSEEDEAAGYGIGVLCEGCGPTLINRAGECVGACLHNHGGFVFVWFVMTDDEHFQWGLHNSLQGALKGLRDWYDDHAQHNELPAAPERLGEFELYAFIENHVGSKVTVRTAKVK